MDCDQTFLNYGILKCDFNALESLGLTESTAKTEQLILNDVDMRGPTVGPPSSAITYDDKVWLKLKHLSIQNTVFDCNQGVCVPLFTDEKFTDVTLAAPASATEMSFEASDTTSATYVSLNHLSTQLTTQISTSTPLILEQPGMNGVVVFVSVLLFVGGILIVVYLIRRHRRHRRYQPGYRPVNIGIPRSPLPFIDNESEQSIIEEIELELNRTVDTSQSVSSVNNPSTDSSIAVQPSVSKVLPEESCDLQEESSVLPEESNHEVSQFSEYSLVSSIGLPSPIERIAGTSMNLSDQQYTPDQHSPLGLPSTGIDTVPKQLYRSTPGQHSPVPHPPSGSDTEPMTLSSYISIEQNRESLTDPPTGSATDSMSLSFEM